MGDQRAEVSRTFGLRTSLLRRTLAGIAFAACVCACGDSDPTTTSTPPRLAVLSAFPAEMVPILERAQIDQTVMVNGRQFRMGHLAGVPVVIGLTGIGLANAMATTHAVLEQFDVAGIVVSAVAGSTWRIGDVTVPDTWTFKNGPSYATDPHWLELASQIAAAGSAALERCTVVPAITPDPVCVDQAPQIIVGGVGLSSDPFSNTPFACDPQGDDLYGCDIPATAAIGAAGPVMHADATTLATPTVNDMETAAIAREAAARGLPFIAFRAVSDGAGDPLALPGALNQFSAYYRFAARNAAAMTTAFLQRIAALSRH